MSRMKQMILMIVVVLVGCVTGCEPKELPCDHLWMPGATQEYVQKVLAEGWENIVYYYTCVACGGQIGLSCELETSTFFDIVSEVAETPELVIEESDIVAPSTYIESETGVYEPPDSNDWIFIDESGFYGELFTCTQYDIADIMFSVNEKNIVFRSYVRILGGIY